MRKLGRVHMFAITRCSRSQLQKARRILAELLGKTADPWATALLPELESTEAGPAAAARAVEDALVEQYRQEVLPSPAKRRLDARPAPPPAEVRDAHGIMRHRDRSPWRAWDGLCA